MNSFGDRFRLTTFGESHGEAIGGVVDGMPAGIEIDMDFIQGFLDRRRPGQSKLTTQRKEADKVEFLSGIFEGKSTGCPIGFIVRNCDQHSSDYSNIKDLYRPSHADYTYQQKYGIRDYRGGGRASARVTISRCVAGALAMLVLREKGIGITAYTDQIGRIKIDKPYTSLDLKNIDNNPVRCPDAEKAALMEQEILQLKTEGDSTGGCITCVIKGCPVGLGSPEFGKLHACLASAMMSINAAKGFEYGGGFAMAERRGSEVNDEFYVGDDVDANNSLSALHSPLSTSSIRTRTNNSGGIQGGISNGEDIYFRVAFKPVATILKKQQTVSVEGKETAFQAKGRHDPCVVPRAVPIVEAMAALVILDNLL